MKELKKISQSEFELDFKNFQSLNDIFMHYGQQIYYIMKLQPKSVLEIGPGTHVVEDFLSRRGIIVKTFDNDPTLEPDFQGDVRTIKIKERFELILASEVLEHVDFKYFDDILNSFNEISTKYVILSLPYPTIHLFGEGKLISPNKGIVTGIPLFFLANKEYPEDRFNVHHWNIGKIGTTREDVRKIILNHFDIIEEKLHLDSNCIFYLLKRRI